MPRLAANLNWLFAERPFMERFGAAAAAGFSAVELLTPYEHAAAAVQAVRMSMPLRRCRRSLGAMA